MNQWIIFIDQEKYAKQVVENFGLTNSKKAKIPINSSLNNILNELDPSTKNEDENFNCRKALGMLNFVAGTIRPYF